MNKINYSEIPSPMEGISKLSLQQITSCINNYLEMRLDTLVTGYTDGSDHCEWEVKENDVTGRIWVTLDANDRTMKNIGYGLRAGVKQQDNTVQLTAIYIGCIHALIELSNNEETD
ncbi:MAG: hypothetical protein VX237_02505 [Chloroflexota bacterium]|nr:hypothetical protein [Chloroflexota bacterium]